MKFGLMSIIIFSPIICYLSYNEQSVFLLYDPV